MDQCFVGAQGQGWAIEHNPALHEDHAGCRVRGREAACRAAQYELYYILWFDQVGLK